MVTDSLDASANSISYHFPSVLKLSVLNQDSL